jgi:hypothetical protein
LQSLRGRKKSKRGFKKIADLRTYYLARDHGKVPPDSWRRWDEAGEKEEGESQS